MPWPGRRSTVPLSAPFGMVDLQGAPVRQRDLVGGAPRRVEERHLQGEAQVGAARRSSSRLGPPRSRRRGTGSPPGRTRRIGPRSRRRRSGSGRRPARRPSRASRPPPPGGGGGGALGAGGVDLAAVEAGALVGIGQKGVGGADRLEARLGLRLVRVGVGVPALGEAAIRLADVVRRGGAGNAQNLVRIVHCGPSFMDLRDAGIARPSAAPRHDLSIRSRAASGAEGSAIRVADRTTGMVSGGLMHAAAENRQQRPDHWRRATRAWTS